MNKAVIVIGASGHGKVVADIVRQSGDTVLGFLDDADGLPNKICGIPILGKTAEFKKYPNVEFVIAIGNASIRRKIAESMAGVGWYTAIHPTAVISSMDTSIGAGSVVMANAVVNPSAQIGQHCIINTTAVVEHDCRVGDFAHISVGAKLGGTVVIGENTWVGIGAVTRNNLTVCPDCTIGAGAIVVKNITESGTYVGVPARKLK